LQTTTKNISAASLVQLMKEPEAIQLIDVREDDEHQEFNIGGLLLPLGSITQNIHLIEKEKPVIVYCRKGVRSRIAIQRLERKYPFNNLINLEGGIESWKKEFRL
jgi:adenylyltransferase/sulfurtransferase